MNNKEKKRRHTKKRTNQKRKRQLGGFLSPCDFAYAGRDTVNQVAKVVPGVIKAATNGINDIAKDRINQIIGQGGKEVERVLPKILRGAIEDVYQMPLRLLGNFGKQQLNKIKRKILHKNTFYYLKYWLYIFPIYNKINHKIVFNSWNFFIVSSIIFFSKSIDSFPSLRAFACSEIFTHCWVTSWWTNLSIFSSLEIGKTAGIGSKHDFHYCLPFFLDKTLNQKRK